ncbi:MAG: 3-phosphoshikimate 1-carboxyvinyltransferase [Bacteroidota bacterium]
MIKLSRPLNPIKAQVRLPGSKSISNRLLIIKHVLGAGLTLHNISNAEDTALLQKALQQIAAGNAATIDVHHAGTDLRFLTALLSVTSGEWRLTGSERIKQRPIGELVTALKMLGAEISYEENINFPPLVIRGKRLQGGTTAIEAGVSSQFISALLLIAPLFEKGLQLSLKGDLVSAPYIQMTIKLLQEFGVMIQQEKNVISISKTGAEVQKNQAVDKTIESDWSSASYWYSICALSPGAQIELGHLTEQSLQPDSAIAGIFSKLGVQTTFTGKGVVLRHIKAQLTEFDGDFTNCPDIAQTVAVTCFGLGIKARLTGLKTLRVKETDRIAALKNEFEKLGAKVIATTDTIEVEPVTTPATHSENTIATYNDHRMAMSFAPLAMVYGHIKIQHHQVVHKSYPDFWEDLKSAGFSVNLRV